MNRERMRILYVAPYAPSELMTRPRLLLDSLAQRHDLHILTLRGHVPARIPSGVVHELHEPDGIDRALSLRRVFGRDEPLQSIAVASRRLRGAVAAALSSNVFDVVHVEHVRGWQFLPATVEAPIVFDAVDCVSKLFELAALHQPRSRRWLYAHEAARLRRCESVAMRAAARVVVASERDREAVLQVLPGTAVSVISNPVDTARLRPGPERRAPTVVMSGKLSYHANAVAARWLCDEVWPRVRAVHPEAMLLIAGAMPSRDLLRRATTDIRVTGWVDDIGALLGEAMLAVAPLRYAVGVQNKVLEAMACATPVIATRMGIGDLQVRAGRECLVADSAEELAARISFLLSNPALARRIGLAGRRYVEKWHGCEQAADLFDAEYRAATRCGSHNERITGAAAGR